MRRLFAQVVLVASLGFAVVGCGGGGSKSTGTKPAPGATTTPATQQSGAPTVSTGPVRGSLRAADHTPTVNRPWRYSVRVADSAGKPLSGTVEIQFMFGGQVVGRDTPPSHAVTNGHWQDNLKFPAAALGMPLTFRAVVHTTAGSIVLDWPIKVQK